METKSVMLQQRSVRLVTSQGSAIPISSISLNILRAGGKKQPSSPICPNFRAGSESCGNTKGISFCYCLDKAESLFSSRTELCLSQMGTAVPDALIAVDAVVFRILKPINMGWPDGEALVQMQTVQRLVASLNCCWFTPQQSPSSYLHCYPL